MKFSKANTHFCWMGGSLLGVGGGGGGHWPLVLPPGSTTGTAGVTCDLEFSPNMECVSV